jgi:hypothetical protein
MTEPSDDPSLLFFDDDDDALFLQGNLPTMVSILPTDLVPLTKLIKVFIFLMMGKIKLYS